MNRPTEAWLPIAFQDLHPSKPKHTRKLNRASFIKWLRKLHGWIGLWGAMLGLLFGTTGILLNHRALLKIPAAKTQESVLQLPLPTPAPTTIDGMASWLQSSLMLERGASRVRSEPEKTVAWGDKSMQQPEHWMISFTTPRVSYQGEYWRGNSFVSVKRSDNNIFASLNNLHKGTGVGVGWILLVDSLAGSIIFLSLSGVLLWALQNRRRVVGAGIFSAAMLATVTLALLTI